MRGQKIEPHVWRVAFVVILGTMMSVIDQTVVNVALNRLGHALHASVSGIQWVVTGYLLALAAVIPLTGWSARRFGARRVYLVSLAVFTLGSAICALAQALTPLVIFRVLQGLGGGMLQPVGMIIMADTAGPKRLAQMLSMTTCLVILGPILGPVIGGLILAHLGWQWIFMINVPLGAVALGFALKYVPRSYLGEAGRFDLWGLVLLGCGLPALTYGISEFGTSGTFGTPAVAIPIALGVALLVAFWAHSKRTERPLLDLGLFRRPAFAAAAGTMFFLTAALFGAMILLPLYYQLARGLTPVTTGLLLAPTGLGVALISPFSSRLTNRVGAGALVTIGVTVTLLATLPLTAIDAHTSYVVISATLVVRGLGIGVAFTPAFAAAFRTLRPEEVSDASPQLNVLQRLGGSIGTAVLAVVLQRASGGSATVPAVTVHGFQIAYWWSAGVTALALPSCVIMLRALRGVGRQRRELAGVPAPDVLA